MNNQVQTGLSRDSRSEGTAAILRADRVNQIFTMGRGQLHILKDLTLDVPAGDTVSITGASGSGKSTLLHILGGLDKPTGGRVIFQNSDLYAMTPWKRTLLRARQVGFVFQAYHLLPELDVLENVMLPAMNHRVRLASWANSLRPGDRRKAGGFGVRERALALITAVGLEDRADHLPTELSGGEQQRVSLARALMNEPDIILADEPTGNLDAATGGQVLDYLFALVRERSKTLILVTHNQAVAGRCARVFELKEGRLI